MDLNVLRAWIKHLLFSAVSCGRTTLALCLILSGELGDVGDGGRLRCLHGKVDTTISMCTCTVGSAQCSERMIYDPDAVTAI